MVIMRSLFLLIVFASVVHAAEPFVPRAWNDFPVRIAVDGAKTLAEIEGMLPGRGPDAHDHLRDGFLEVRVTRAEQEMLEARGFAVERLEDLHRAARTETERAWAQRSAKRALDDFTWPLNEYPTHAEVGQILTDLANLRPDIARVDSIGTSVDGRLLWNLTISDQVGVDEVEPEVRLASGIHGDETVQMVNLLNLAHELVTSYDGGDARLQAIVDDFELHIQPLFNPDGYVRGVRRNANGIDLNRNFPEPDGSHSTQQPETVAFMNHALSKHFVVSLMGHGGALVVNYPWDYTYTRAPDDDALIQLSLEYSVHNVPMYNGWFSQGITNGADWYVATGTLQDWVYHRTGACDVTLEVSNTKWPSASSLVGYWNDNRESLLSYVEAARAGLSGVVTDANTGQPLDATVTVSGINRAVTSDPATGDYYKLLDTGVYTITFDAVGYDSQTFFSVATTWGTPNVLDVQLVSEATDAPSIVQAPRIDRIAPNPFNPRTQIAFSLPRAGSVRLEIVDVRGRRVRSLLDTSLSAGAHDVVWLADDDSGRGVGAGVYFVNLVAEGVTRTASITLVP